MATIILTGKSTEQSGIKKPVSHSVIYHGLHPRCRQFPVQRRRGDADGLERSQQNNDFIITTGNVVTDLLHNFHLERGARLNKLRVYQTLSDPTGREVCGYS